MFVLSLSSPTAFQKGTLLNGILHINQCKMRETIDVNVPLSHYYAIFFRKKKPPASTLKQTNMYMYNWGKYLLYSKLPSLSLVSILPSLQYFLWTIKTKLSIGCNNHPYDAVYYLYLFIARSDKKK